MSKKSEISHEVGSIVEIELGDGRKAYGKILRNPLIGFYDICSRTTLSVDEVVVREMAFKVWVVNSAVASGRWKIVGKDANEVAGDDSPWFFKQDAISKSLKMYREGFERAATLEECKGLERAAVWSAEHIESRLADHFDGRTNKWVESLKVKV